MKSGIDDLIEQAMTRLSKATDLAAGLRGNEILHRLSIETVFVLEDTVLTLRQMARRAMPTADTSAVEHLTPSS